MKDRSSALNQELPKDLVSEIALISSKPMSAGFSTLVEKLKSRFGASLDAVILYGSCLRSHEIDDGVVDFYVIVNSYHNAYPEHYLRYFNVWLPPNVFYLETSDQKKTLRAKYAVVSMEDFKCGNRHWFHPYLWARFAQPVRLLYCRNEVIRDYIYDSLGHAVITFLRNSLAAIDLHEVTAEEIWAHGLTLTYAAELRPEKKTRAHQLIQFDLDNYAQLTEHALPALAGKLEGLPQLKNEQRRYRVLFSALERQRSLKNWRLRRWQGRILSILRLIKATFTFRDCIDYAAWKIERHTGVLIEITPMLRRHPVIWGCKVFWKLLRRGVLR